MNCDICGRFVGRGGSWAHKYDMVAMAAELEHLKEQTDAQA